MFRIHNNGTVFPDFLPASEYILYMLRFDVYKHRYEVVSTYTALPQAFRKRYLLIFVGEKNLSEVERIKALISTFGLEGRVLLLNSIPYQCLPPPDHHAYLNIFAASCENHPDILPETLVSGRPMICSNVMPSRNSGNMQYFIFPRLISKKIGDVLAGALSIPELLKNLFSAAILQSGKFDWENTSKQTWSELLAWPNVQKKVLAR